MDTLYERIFAGKADSCCEGCPVVIAASAIQKNTRNHTTYAQVKFCNIGEKKIRTLKVFIRVYNDRSELIEEVEYVYHNCDAGINDNFGQKDLIKLRHRLPHSIDVRITEIVFEDGSCLRENFSDFRPLTAPTWLGPVLGEDLLQQYRLETCSAACYVPVIENGFWRCTCGAINFDDALNCYCCKSNKKTQFDVLDTDRLRENKVAVESEERRAREEKEADLALKSKRRSTAIILTAVVLILIFACVGWLQSYSKQGAAYNEALSLIEEGKYDEGIEALENLNGFSDSEKKLAEAKIQKLLTFIEEGDYEAAKEYINYQGDDAAMAEVYNEALYNEALKLLETDGTAARAIFAELGDYKDSADYLEGFAKLLYKESDDYWVTTYSYENGIVSGKTDKYKKSAVEYTTTYEYDEKGTLVKSIREGNAATANEYRVVDYDEKGNAIRESYYDESDSDKLTVLDIEYTYHSNGNNKTVVINKTVKDKKTDKVLEGPTLTTKYTYTEEGYEESKEYSNGSKYVYEYDDKGTQISSEYITSLGVSEKDVFTVRYDDEGRILTKTTQEGKVCTYEYDDDGDLIKCSGSGWTTITKIYSYFYVGKDAISKTVGDAE